MNTNEKFKLKLKFFKTYHGCPKLYAWLSNGKHTQVDLIWPRTVPLNFFLVFKYKRMEFLTFLVSLTGTETITIGAMCGHLKQRKQNIVKYIALHKKRSYLCKNRF
jgi:hypothetical protein